MLPRSARRICASSGQGTLSMRALPAITMPGMQKPHCTAPTAPKAYTKASCSAGLSPSTVNMFLPAALLVLSTQAFTALPSTIMVQVPQAPSLHPSFTEVRCKSSRR